MVFKAKHVTILAVILGIVLASVPGRCLAMRRCGTAAGEWPVGLTSSS